MIAINKFNGYAPDGRRLYFKGGGGSSPKNYAGLEKLYQEQAASARLLRDQAEMHLPGATVAYVDQVSRQLAPGRAEQQAALAGADMASANAMERAATTRDLTSMGVNAADPRYAASLRSLETTNAARLAAGRNLARNETENRQLAVAQDAVGTFTGQSNSAASQMNGASSGLAGLASQQSAAKQAASAQQSQNVANAVGGTMAVASMWKDGGEIRKLADGGPVRRGANGLGSLARRNTVVGGLVGEFEDNGRLPSLAGALFKKDGGAIRPLERHMLGGRAGEAQQRTQQGFFRMQEVAPPPQQVAPQQPGTMDSVMQAAQTYRNVKNMGEAGTSIKAKVQAYKAGTNLTPDQAEAASSAYREAAANTTDKAAAQRYNQMADKIQGGSEGPFAQAQAPAPVSEASAVPAGEAVAAPVAESAALESTTLAPIGAEAGAAAGQAAGEQLAGQALGQTATEQVVGQAATSAATSGAAGAATSAGLGAAMGAIGTAMPWIGAAYLAGNLLGAWKDGGEIPAQDLRDGAAIEGPGSHTDDVIPAIVSAGEGVLNGEAMALGGDAVMERLNEKGLKLREAGKTPTEIRKAVKAGKIKTGLEALA